ncbi:MAG: T9SS type A sorting domain-containing protein [Bacteroidales bacterium]|nr:T9SS type A sorting domain-containing protein [Bacteroidales bacterium]
MKTIFDRIGLALLICLLPALVSAQAVQTLPFYDDFSSSNIYPDSTKWIDRNAYINSGFPLNPVTRNAATLDVLDEYGEVYDYAISNPFIAEYLSSTTIRLDSVFEPTPKALTPADSLYFSFFYQPQGNGNPPENPDSLVLEFGFIEELDTVWNHVWSTPGRTLSQFLQENDNNFFKQVMIPITDPKYFTSNFFFRFYNYASIVSQSQPNSRSNEDNWNIDVVYINYDRSIHDTSYPKICFTGQAPSFLNRYQSMPYKHYRANPTASIAENPLLHFSNLDNQNHTLKYSYTVEQVNGVQSYAYVNDDPIEIDSATYCEPYSTTVYKLFAIDYDRDTTSFIIRHYISDSTVNPPMVDSLVYTQGFYNYFAYDDGTPELGYGVEPSGGAFAVRFDLNELDTLRGVQILFNHTLNDANYNYFDIVVWKDNDGKPGDEVYRLSNLKPRWEDHIYQFSYYKFDRLVKLNGTFYIGIVQQSSGLINIGFDSSRDNSQYNFYNDDGSWHQSLMAGSIMLRPVVGGDYYIDVDEIAAMPQVRVYPNPASSTIHIDGLDNGASINLYDITGRMVMHSTFTGELSVSQLTSGLYLLNITTTDGIVISKKIMVNQ